MTVNIKCTTCDGTGEIENNGPKPCTGCGGNGYIEVPGKPANLCPVIGNLCFNRGCGIDHTKGCYHLKERHK